MDSLFHKKILRRKIALTAQGNKGTERKQPIKFSLKWRCYVPKGLKREMEEQYFLPDTERGVSFSKRLAHKRFIFG